MFEGRWKDAEEMRHSIPIFLLSLSAAVCFSASALAQDDREKVNAAVRFLLAGTDRLTSDEYDKFWKMMPEVVNEDRNEIIAAMREMFSDSLELQKYTWACAKQAWLTQRVPGCPEAFNLFKKMRKRAIRNGIPTDTWEDSLENIKRLLAAASSRSIVKSYDNREVELSLELINSTIATMELRFSRLSDALK